ncbi:hypothetical protein BDB00DRAFT_788517 [Zychaea mexicana]|uniref:uncharacterized protein n=1 Tax=Zychaea mexicana TaxID=64656 RepID=UPI0022FE40E0|nr:uncharacterized protein BDB00DRAFT_788517 [Zychaea mexicana]KAI9492693.1 hypothetical protein BDB00DRAFT_788517 [Zychaea mexicana]
MFLVNATRQSVVTNARRTYATSAKPKRRVGAVSGGVLGFIAGVGAALAVSDSFHFQDEYVKSTRQLAASVDELRTSTEKVREYADSVERVDRDFAQVKAQSVSAKDLEQLKRDIYKLHDTMSHDHVELKARVWKMEHRS